MEYLRVFDTKADYESVKDSLVYPTISYIEDMGKVWCKKKNTMPPIIDVDDNCIVAVYDIPEANNEVILLGHEMHTNDYGYDDYGYDDYGYDNNYISLSYNIEDISSMYIDDERLNEPVSSYTFTTSGEHIIKYYFDNTSYNSEDNVTYAMFKNVNCVKSIYVGSNLDQISAGFASNSSLENIFLTKQDAYAHIGGRAFDGSKLKNIIITQLSTMYSIHSIDNYSFYGIPYNGNLYIPFTDENSVSDWFLPTSYEESDDYGGYEEYTRYNLKYYNWNIIKY